jgi:lipopolysaccharide export system permease protein
MKINTILNRYLFFELIPPFVVNLVFFAFIFLITRVLEIINMVLNYQVSPVAFIRLLIYSMPFFLSFVIPMSVMMAVLLTFVRMSNDNEVMAIKSCGINPHRFLIPVITFCFLGWGLTTFTAVIALPWGNQSFYRLSLELAREHVDSAIKERAFVDEFKGLTLYVSQVDTRTKTLVDVFIEDRRTAGINNTIVAPKGYLTSEPENDALRLTLFEGVLNQVNLDDYSANTVKFDSYDMRLDLAELVASASGQKKSEAMTLAELRTHIDSLKDRKNHDYYNALMRYHEKFALPFACFALGILAVPLGIQPRKDKRSFGIVVGIVLFLIYYMLLSLGWSLGESGAYHPILGMWTPNVVLGGLGIILYVHCMRDKPLDLRNIIGILKLRQYPRRKDIRIDDADQ